ncbi:hypothetical protein F444_01472 [Phytophthora nicotianae P1976]|uniref:Uncharacterized protein n=1 Tax=Phytophthora nicotianae P1976 TaxID=1317066 RepID=A0A081B0H5_PHYNI|nr:hypothetical protein F444_01472 [Phytophthora nicotianae P1976]
MPSWPRMAAEFIEDLWARVLVAWPWLTSPPSDN